MNKPSRRAVVRTGVWAVPVVATAAAAPAFAGTQNPCVTLTNCVKGCKKSSEGDDKTSSATPDHQQEQSCSYEVTLHFSCCDQGETVTIVSWDMTGTPATSVSPSVFTVGSGTTSKTFTVTESGTPGSSLTLTYQVGGVNYTTSVPLPPFGSCDDGEEDD